MTKNKTKLSSIDKRIFKYWQAFYLAFYASRLYIDVAKRWKGFGFLYFFLIVAFALIPLSIKTMYTFHHYYEKELQEPFTKLPNFQIQQGKLIFDLITPYVIKNEVNDGVIIIDPISSLTEINYVYPHWMMFISSDRFYLRLPKLSILPFDNSANEDTRTEDIQMQSFSDLQQGSFNIASWLKQTNFSRTKWYIIAMIYPVLVMTLFGFFCMMLSIVALIGKMFSRVIFRFKMNFRQVYRLLLVSSGTAVTLFSVGLIYVDHIPGIGAYFLFTVLFYFCFAILVVRKESKHMVLA